MHILTKIILLVLKYIEMRNEYYNGVSDEEFVKYFNGILHSRMELTQYQYPYEKMESQEAIDDHIIRSQSSLFEYILESVRESVDQIDDNINEDETLFIHNKKKAEILPMLTDVIGNYVESVKVKYIKL